MPADTHISFRVPSETKERLRDLAEQQGITESAVIRQVLYLAHRGSEPIDAPTPAESEPAGRHQRMSISLPSEDRARLKERASARGMASATYVALLVRSHLTGIAPLPKLEYLALRQAVHELTAIGRNLNQIARAIYLSGNPALPGRTEVFAMLKIAESLRDHFKELLKANAASWNHRAQATR